MVTSDRGAIQRVHEAHEQPSRPPSPACGVGVVTPLLVFNLVIAGTAVGLWHLGLLPRGWGAHVMLVTALVDAWMLKFWITN